ncbi:MAG: bacterial Ig-like domain-containing protein [Clostridia bacterium]|nr:bacterial Ig-like domain-containing protein [Clostridia bacterium]
MKKTLTAFLSFVFAVSLCGAVACVTESGPEALSAPEIRLEGNVVSWNPVDHASGYDVYVAEDSAVSVTETTYTVSKTEVGNYEIYVIATTTDENYKSSAASNKVTYTIAEPAVLSSIALASAPEKDVYYLDEKATEPDLTGLSIKAKYSNDTERDIALSALTVSEVNLTTVGEKQITLSYTEDGITKDVKLNVEVKERTIADMKSGSYTVKNNEYSTSATRYELADGNVTALNMKGEEVAVTYDGGKTYIAASNFEKPSAVLLRVIDEQQNVTFIKVTAATYVAAVEDFNAINNALDGYYVLTNDLYFENNSAMIGKAALIADAEGANAVIDPTGTGNATGQKGEAFTGTFDGNGYILHDYSIAFVDGTAWKAQSFYMGMFGWIGEGATVCNFTLRGSTVRGGQNSAMIAGVNDGIIENVVIESDCKLEVQYFEHGAFAACNNGKINNVICYTENFPRNEEIKVTNVALEGNGKVENSYMNDSTDLTETLGAGWFYINNYGTVYGNETYAIVLSYDNTWYIGREAHISLFIKNTEIDPVVAFQTWGISGVDGSESVKYVSYDAETYTYTVKLADGITDANIAGNQFNLGVQIVGQGYVFTGAVKLGEAFVTGATAEDFNLTEGMEIDVAGKQIELTYSDGSTKTVEALRAEGYDKNGVVGTAQTVRLFYGNGENEYVEVSVTPVAKQVTAVKVSEKSTHKTSFTVNEMFSFAGLKLEISYDNGTNETVTATSANVNYSSVNMTTAGSYTVTLSYGGQTGSYTVNVASASLSTITVSGTPAKTQYKIGESVTVADLAGVTVTANYSDGSKQPVTITAAMLSYDFSAAGSKDITVTYQGKTAKITVTVKDFVYSLSVTLKNAANKSVEYSSTSAADFGAICNYTATMKSGSTMTVTSGVSATVEKSGLHKVEFTYDGVTVTPDIEFEIWYIVTTVADWNSINDNLAGYYALNGDLDFNYNATAIGVAPLCIVGEDTYIDNGSVANSNHTRDGKAFTGIFDGRGHKLIHFRVGEYEVGYNQDYMGMSLFAFVGEGGKVTDFEVASAILSVCNFGSLAVCLNKGEVSNVIISAENRFDTNWNASSSIVTVNDGTVKNCVSYLTACNVMFNSTVGELPVISQNNGTIENVLGLSTQISLDGTVKADVYYYAPQSDYEPSFWTWGVPNYGDGENNGNAVVAGWAGYTAANSSYHWTLTLAENTGLTSGSTFTLGVKINGGDYLATYTILVTGEQSVAYCL